jgi:lipopolysaccharide biosynthesis regulator YciM
VARPTHIAVLLTASLALAACGDGSGPYLNMAPHVTNVGRDACLECHAGNYVTYIQSEMGRSFRPATLALSDAQFEGIEPIYDPDNDLYFLPFNRGEDLFIMEYRVADGDTVHKRIEQIDYIVGSGQHTNSHIMEENGYLYQMPLTWYAQDGKWSLPPRFDHGSNYRFDRPIPVECMTCHNDTPVFDVTSQNRYDYVPHGIGCERCHGPGSLHLERWKADGIPDTNLVIDTYASTDKTIVNPRKLSIDRQIDICQRCHMQGATVYGQGMTALDYRPGMDLSEVLGVYSPRFADSTRNFIMASHPDRLAMSECFRSSHAPGSVDNPMTCITCHNTHVSIDILGPDHYQLTCKTCHTPERRNECTEDEAIRVQAENDCASCHMPISGSTDIPHVRITDHYIRVPDPTEPQLQSPVDTTGAEGFFGLASHMKLDPSTHDLADAYLAYYEGRSRTRPDFLDSAAVLLESLEDKLSPRFQKSQLKLLYWQNRFDQIRALSRDLDPEVLQDPLSCFRLGEAFAAGGQYGQAIRYLEQGARVAPFHLHILMRLAEVYTSDGQAEAALETYNRIAELNPKFNVYNNRGFLRLLEGDLEGAEDDFRKALHLDPDLVRAIENMASLYVNTDRLEQARPYVKRLLELDPENEGYRMLSNLLQPGE